MKYAVALPADQTIVYIVDDHRPGPGLFGETTSHSEATLFESREAVDAFLAKHDYVDVQPMSEEEASAVPDDKVAFVEEVPDESEFRAREDTW